MGWDVREADVTAAPVLAALNGVVQSLHHEHEPDRYKAPNSDALIPKLEEWCADPDVLVLLAIEEESGVPLGYLIGMVRTQPGHALVHRATVAELDQIGVIPDARRRGLGDELIGRMIGWARARGAERIELGVRAWNESAQAAFRNAGFQTVMHRMARQPNED